MPEVSQSLESSLDRYLRHLVVERGRERLGLEHAHAQRDVAEAQAALQKHALLLDLREIELRDRAALHQQATEAVGGQSTLDEHGVPVVHVDHGEHAFRVDAQRAAGTGVLQRE